MKTDDDILIDEARRFNYQAEFGDIHSRHDYRVIAIQLDKGVSQEVIKGFGSGRKCPICQEPLNYIANYCSNCGQKLEKGSWRKEVGKND